MIHYRAKLLVATVVVFYQIIEEFKNWKRKSYSLMKNLLVATSNDEKKTFKSVFETKVSKKSPMKFFCCSYVTMIKKCFVEIISEVGWATRNISTNRN